PSHHPTPPTPMSPPTPTRRSSDLIAIGNGTAGRETEAFVRALGLPGAIPIVMVNESGASIYSASEVAREEFPDHDLTVRGSVSIDRKSTRLNSSHGSMSYGVFWLN